MADDSAAAGSDVGYWNLGVTTALGLAKSGVFGGRVQNFINPQSALSQPAAAPPPPPVAGQLSVNPPPVSSGGVMGHLKRNWWKYAIGAGIVGLGGVLLMRRK